MNYKISISVVLSLIALYSLTFFPTCAQGRIMIVNREDAGKKIYLQVGDVVQIQLTGTPTTGFWWHFQALNENYLEIIKTYTKPYTSKDRVPKEMEGGPIMGVWQLLVKKAGTTTVEMSYYRSWEEGDTAKHRFCVILKINAEGLNINQKGTTK